MDSYYKPKTRDEYDKLMVHFEKLNYSWASGAEPTYHDYFEKDIVIFIDKDYVTLTKSSGIYAGNVSDKDYYLDFVYKKTNSMFY